MQVSLKMSNQNVVIANAMIVQVPDPLSQLKSMFGVWHRIVRPSHAHELAATSSAEPSSAAPAPAANVSHTAEAAASTGMDADPMADEASHSPANDAKMQPAVTDTAAGDDPAAALSPVCIRLDGKGSYRQRRIRRPRKSFPPAAEELAVMEPVVQPAPAHPMTRAAAKQAEAPAGPVLTFGPPAPDEPVAIESGIQPAPAQRMTRGAAKQAELQAGHVLRSGKVSAGRPTATLALPSGRGSAAQTTRGGRGAGTAQQADKASQCASATSAAQQGHGGTVQQGTLAAAMLADGGGVRATPGTLRKSAVVPAAPEAVASGIPIAKRRPGRPAKHAAVPSPNKPEAASVAGGKSPVLSRPGRGRHVTAQPAHADPEAADATPAAKPRAAIADLQGTNAEPGFPGIKPISAEPGSARARPGTATFELEAATADPAATTAEPEAAASSQAAAQDAHLKQPASAPCARAQSTACAARGAVQPGRHCCRNRRCKACRAKAEADKQSTPADTPSSHSDAIPDDKAAATTTATDSSHQAQLGAALTPQQPPKPGRDAEATPADPAAIGRSVRAASRANDSTEGTTPGASGRPRSTTRKRHREEESDTEQLPMRPMPARLQQRSAPAGHASQQADNQTAAVAQPAGPVSVDLPTGSAAPAEVSSDRATLAAQSSDGLSPAGVSSDEPAAAMPSAKLFAPAQGPEQLPAAQAPEAAAVAAAAPDRSYCSAKAQGLTQIAAANHVADAAAVSHDIALPGETPARRSARSRKATEKAAAADGSFAALAKGPKLPSDTAHQAPIQQDRPAACSPAGRGTKRAADVGVSAPSAPAALTLSKSVARKKRRQSAGAAGADHRHRKAVNDDEDVEIFTEVHTKAETAKHLGGSIDKVSRGVRKTPGGRGRAALPHQSQMPSVNSLDMLIAAAAEVETGLAPKAEVCH